jgi:hypothetical protein
LFASEEDKRRRSAGEHIEAGIFGWTVVLAVTLIGSSVGFAISSPGDWRSRLGVAVTAAGLFLAAVAIGAALGFLFGLPRVRTMAQTDGDNPTSEPSTGSHFLANSNLLKVSDWLTTILIGLGLVQLGRVAPAVTDFAAAIEDPLGGSASAGAFAVSIMLGAAITSALMAYLWTSIRVRNLFEQAEKEYAELQRKIKEAQDSSGQRDRSVQAGAAASGGRFAAADLARDILLLAQHAEEQNDVLRRVLVAIDDTEMKRSA